jgi:hypothetical protein
VPLPDEAPADNGRRRISTLPLKIFLAASDYSMKFQLQATNQES